MIVTDFEVTSTDVETCEACWRAPVEAARQSSPGSRDLLCIDCAEAGYPARTVLFPPLGIRGLTRAKVEMGKHKAPGPPKMPPDPGPPLPTPRPTPTPNKPPV
ncbi:hypothetical protein [Streptomyces sp. WM4235]|uniref:hypothetical protein n=1 Tax=Streptomyces sp. WM4235 TaxID=1415551 RepID=UPI0006AE3721|nr:hypothetical protein [Streptomyces sp. WM4235]